MIALQFYAVLWCSSFRLRGLCTNWTFCAEQKCIILFEITKNRGKLLLYRPALKPPDLPSTRMYEPFLPLIQRNPFGAMENVEPEMCIVTPIFLGQFRISSSRRVSKSHLSQATVSEK
ncbi:hypothetical protein EV421DRAFT_1842983 [Armillaria borealis]|uniref:Secreted protein n=1 Tax=Armillaria borealis TaxID=47425 RepID=A0AA39MH63_9AGAR|nr:hypothetical protein EV421DRAFT_1842983 [Armillaria borealis]